MKRILHAVKDTYITNKIIDDKFRATDTNVGLAGTLDLFKLANESPYTGSSPYVSGTNYPIELSRILIKFDINPLRALTSSILDINNSSFNCTLKLSDVYGGQTVPSNFSIILYPLSQSFDEGIGRDVSTFEDIDAANYITSSMSSGTTLWFMSGADAGGYVGQQSVDYITGSMQLGDLYVVQQFSDGTEDLSVDVTKIVSATLTGQIPDYGYRLSFSGTQETDSRSRFVKRFATRHSSNVHIRPSITVGFNDAIRDNHGDFYFNLSGSLFLRNYARGTDSNIVSGVALTPITGVNSLMLTIVSGNYVSGSLYRKSVTGSQCYIGQNQIPGLYSASFAISPNESSSILNEVITANSATFTEIWGSIDGTVGYYTGSFVAYYGDKSTVFDAYESLKVTCTNMKRSYASTEKVRFRMFAQDSGFKLKVSKLPIQAKSLIFANMHYRIVDVNSNEIVYDFDTVKNSTLLSTDSDGMYFDVYMSDLESGRSYGIDILINERSTTRVFTSVGGTFRID